MLETTAPVNSMQAQIRNRLYRDFSILSKKKPLYHITINPKEAKHVKDLQFLTGKYLKRLRNTFFKSTFEFLFVIEYSKVVSIGSTPMLSNRLGEHVHLVIYTDVGTDDIFNLSDNGLDRVMCFLSTEWEGPMHIHGERIDDNTNLNSLQGYLLKQLHLMTWDNYHSNI